MGQAALAEDRKQEQIKELFKQYNRLKSEGKLQEAQLVTAKLKQLAPDQPEIVAIAGHADANSAAGDYAAIKANNEKIFRKGLNDAEDSGPYVNSDNPVHINGPTLKIAKERGEGVDAIMRGKPLFVFRANKQTTIGIMIPIGPFNNNAAPIAIAATSQRSFIKAKMQTVTAAVRGTSIRPMRDTERKC